MQDGRPTSPLWFQNAVLERPGREVGSHIPQKLTAIYLIVLGPIAMVFVSIYLFMQASWLTRLPLASQTLGWTNGQRPIVAVLFVFLALLAAIFSIQYFTILAPRDLCASRPHFDFLWKSVDGFAITHCMSGTDEINAHGLYYFCPSIIQSWGHVAWPLITAFFLAKTWRVWRANTKFAA
ncbi:hypothetical protein FJ546_29035 [Mesorhizobium sp. B2-4-19]|uniref:hypothetical protein n=1 Tax=Mesorhizobium sp. B2-4-19 TaxID=2589930 RepID=UPI00112D089A|nr:hypothetical protein [Mesorhizobium sp. B2-4-19]TPK55862.1 hypothetical protein FJ546_29035 [Mesorhizobium sp. B2-4-19]